MLTLALYSGVRKLAAALGWEEELQTLWNETLSERQDDDRSQDEGPKTKDEELNCQIARLTEEVNRSLQISSEHEAKVRDRLAGEGQQEAGLDDAASLNLPNVEGQTPIQNLNSPVTVAAREQGLKLVEESKQNAGDAS